MVALFLLGGEFYVVPSFDRGDAGVYEGKLSVFKSFTGRLVAECAYPFYGDGARTFLDREDPAKFRTVLWERACIRIITYYFDTDSSRIYVAERRHVPRHLACNGVSIVARNVNDGRLAVKTLDQKRKIKWISAPECDVKTEHEGFLSADARFFVYGDALYDARNFSLLRRGVKQFVSGDDGSFCVAETTGIFLFSGSAWTHVGEYDRPRPVACSVSAGVFFRTRECPHVRCTEPALADLHGTHAMVSANGKWIGVWWHRVDFPTVVRRNFGIRRAALESLGVERWRKFWREDGDASLWSRILSFD